MLRVEKPIDHGGAVGHAASVSASLTASRAPDARARSPDTRCRPRQGSCAISIWHQHHDFDPNIDMGPQLRRALRLDDVYGVSRICVELNVEGNGSAIGDERARVILTDAEPSGLDRCFQFIDYARATGHRIDAKLTW